MIDLTTLEACLHEEIGSGSLVTGLAREYFSDVKHSLIIIELCYANDVIEN